MKKCLWRVHVSFRNNIILGRVPTDVHIMHHKVAETGRLTVMGRRLPGLTEFSTSTKTYRTIDCKIYQKYQQQKKHTRQTGGHKERQVGSKTLTDRCPAEGRRQVDEDIDHVVQSAFGIELRLNEWPRLQGLWPIPCLEKSSYHAETLSW